MAEVIGGRDKLVPFDLLLPVLTNAYEPSSHLVRDRDFSAFVAMSREISAREPSLLMAPTVITLGNFIPAGNHSFH
jgi:hypothetical protein